METIEWIRDPRRQPNGHKDSVVFVSSVTAIFTQSRSSVGGSLDLRSSAEVRDLLTYLLLRRHPILNIDLPLEHPENVSEEIPERVAILKSSAMRMIERALNGERAVPYPIMQLLVESGKGLRDNWLSREEMTLLTLALGLFSDKLLPIDLINIQACLSLWYSSSPVAKSTDEFEFIDDRPKYMLWISTGIERVCYISKEELFQEAAYLGLFASLVRASRMSAENHPIQQILKSEIAMLQQLRQHGSKSNVLNRRH